MQFAALTYKLKYLHETLCFSFVVHMATSPAVLYHNKLNCHYTGGTFSKSSTYNRNVRLDVCTD